MFTSTVDGGQGGLHAQQRHLLLQLLYPLAMLLGRTAQLVAPVVVRGLAQGKVPVLLVHAGERKQVDFVHGLDGRVNAIDQRLEVALDADRERWTKYIR